MYKHFFKRVIDVVLSGMALLCLSPVLLVVTIWLYFANRVASPQPSPKGEGATPGQANQELKSHPSGGDLEGAPKGDLEGASKGASFWSTVFFTQERPGKNATIFKIYKYKTMTDERDADGNLLPDADRLTKVGKFVRSTSIDELPQLWNVFIGDMSLIGPRPLLVKYLPYYTKREQLRHSARPGITGLAQVNGRSHVEWDEKLEFDATYAENISLVLDIKILVQTIINVLKRSDIELLSEDHDLDVIRQQNKKQ